MSGTSKPQIIPFVVDSECVMISTYAALADPAGKALVGQKLAEKYCMECHVVAPSSGRGWRDAPAFKTIANRQRTTLSSLKAVIQQPHTDMLNMKRQPNEADDIASYILTLRKK